MMEGLAELLKESYIERISNNFSSEKLLIFFVCLSGTFIFSRGIQYDSLTGLFWNTEINTLFDFESGPVSKIKLGDILIALVLTLVNAYIYKFIRKTSFNYLIKKKGFEDQIQRWIQRGQVFFGETLKPNPDYLQALKKRIDKKVTKIAFLHSVAEILLSTGITLLIGLKIFNSVDLLFGLICLLLVFWMQRYAYLYYLAKLLPEMVGEATFLEQKFEHGNLWSRQTSKN